MVKFRSPITNLAWPRVFQKIKVKKSSAVTGLAWTRWFKEFKVNVYESHYRPGMVQRVPGSYGKGFAVPLQNCRGPEGTRNLS